MKRLAQLTGLLAALVFADMILVIWFAAEKEIASPLSLNIAFSGCAPVRSYVSARR